MGQLEKTLAFNGQPHSPQWRNGSSFFDGHSMQIDRFRSARAACSSVGNIASVQDFINSFNMQYCIGFSFISRS